MPEGQARLVFTGPTVLARAFRILEDGGYPCAIVGAPEGDSPCGLALAVRHRDLQSVLSVLQALRAAPTRAVSEPQAETTAQQGVSKT